MEVATRAFFFSGGESEIGHDRGSHARVEIEPNSNHVLD